MAAIRKRGPNQWQAQIRAKGHPALSKTFRSRGAAKRWSRAIESEMDTGFFVSCAEAETTTLAVLIERYRNEVTGIVTLIDVARRSTVLLTFQAHVTCDHAANALARNKRWFDALSKCRP